ncbi:glycosyltransferase family 2 protein [Bacteroides cellulosilyticus]|jgi:hypothetical protein|uniref:Glycosyltransferase family 2 protein n=2 Tax=Bacteroides cellulosilyticus TaxID=246787 RepID=A0A412IDN9_9BACE|nr:glycosyltransferase family 2 protein [Bacteroides cellulosilyticus]RGS35022.1 glycosyltransferase family 2 protein [Bacteroides cellulosilyticus]
MTNNPVYSIIIPHHNIPLLLDRCLSSIPQREDVQIIVVDDCSSEKYCNQLHKLERKFNYIEFIFSKECVGGGQARNIGLEHAFGKYVIFADADDFFNYCVDSVLNEYKDKEFDIAYFKGNSLDTNSYLPSNRVAHLNNYIDLYCSGKDKYADKLRYLFGEPWCKIIKRELIVVNNIKYDETKIHNDTTFAYLIGFYARYILVDKRALYCVTTRQDSVSRIISNDRVLSRISVFGRAELFFKKNDIKVPLYTHYVQLVRLLVYGKLFLFRECVKILSDLGYSKLEICFKIVKTFVLIITKRI